MPPDRHMQRYVEIPRAPPPERAVSARLRDFKEISARFDTAEARRQASRCEQCGVPYCQTYCPLHNNIPDWLKMTAEGRFEEAWRLAEATNNFPEICGRICPQDRLCEAKWACSLEQAGHGTVTIGAVEQFLGDTAWDEGWITPRTPRAENGFRVAVVGAGPAGLTAAEELRARGYTVTLYDRHGAPGGLLRFGIPHFKLEKHVIVRRVERILDAGVAFVGRFSLGRDATLQDLQETNDAVLLALGAYQPRKFELPGAPSGLAVNGLTFLLASMADVAVALPDGITAERLHAVGTRVAVIGGGDTAMDCVRTVLRQGCHSVVCIYRKGELDRPGSRRELDKAQAEGVPVIWWAEGDAVIPGGITMIQAASEACQFTRDNQLTIRLLDRHGRERGHQAILVDRIVAAIGSEPESPATYGARDLVVDGRGAVRVDPDTCATSLPGVFAAGDLARGASLAVWAIRDGRAAALGIDRYLRNSRDQRLQAAHDSRSGSGN